MKIEDLYAQTPVDKHRDIIVLDGRLYFENEEYIIESNDELRLVHSQKQVEQQLDQIRTKLSIG